MICAVIGLGTISVASVALTTLCVAFVAAGCVAAAIGLYLLTLSVSAFFYREPTAGATPRTRLAVLIPAHDESVVIARCVSSLRAQTYPRDLYEIVVIADNCTDDTAAIAAHAGADVVMTRDAPSARGKGRALRWGMDRLLAGDAAPAAIVIVDADAFADPGLLAGLARRFEAGAQVVQGEFLVCGDGTMRNELRAAAFLLVNRVRPAGRAVLGLSTHLMGAATLFSRELLLARPWDAFTSTEDVEYGLKLQLGGVRIAFAGEAALRTPPAPNARAAASQELRWDGGWAHLTRIWLPRLVRTALRERRPALLGVAWDLAVPPLGLLAASSLAGLAAGAGLLAAALLPAWALAAWIVATLSVPLYVLVGLRAAHAPRSAYRALALAPALIIGKVMRARRILTFRGDTWVRTERPAETDAGGTV